MPTDGPGPRPLVRDRADLAPGLRMLLAAAFREDAAVGRDRLLEAALAVWAPSEVLDAVQSLPDRVYAGPDEVAGMLALTEGDG